MQNKGAIRLLAIAIALVSLYQLSFTWKTNSVKNDAKEFANGDPDKELVYLDSMASEEVYNFFWIKKFTLRECQERELNLGLDLKGGMNVTLEVSVVDLIKNLSSNSQDPTFEAAIQLAKEKQKDSQEDFVTLFGQAFAEIDKDARLASVFNTIDLKDRITYNSTNEEVLAVLEEETQDAIDNSFNILRTRIDKFGVTQPNIQKLSGNTGRILVELPGIKDPERVRKLLQGTANLEFWETYPVGEVIEYVNQANEKVRIIKYGDAEDILNLENDSLSLDSTKISDVAQTTDTTKQQSLLNLDDTISDATNILDSLKTDSTGLDQATALAKFEKENPLFAVLRPYTNNEGQLISTGAAVGYSHYKDTATVNSYLALKQVKELFPKELKFLWTVKPASWDEAEVYFELISIKVSSNDGTAPLTGDVITNARDELEGTSSTAQVTMTMNGEGANTWARLTRENIGKQIAIVLDNYVYSYPTVQSEISGGNSQITGNFTIAEAKDLANVLKSGKLPAPAIIIEEAVVGPSLGLESINASLISFIIAFLAVLAYMIIYYKGAGLAASVSLVLNLFFLFGVLASLGAVLTLPGIAGIVLTMGMAVDANVIIYERIREELRAGKGLKLAVKDGFKASYSAIIDGNVTTLLTGIILYIFGHGPIQGFATTLCIGILTSLFSAIFITRLIFTYFLERNKNISFSFKFTEHILKDTKINFMGLRKYFYIASITITIIGMVSLFTRGLNFGIDFTGGRSYIIELNQKTSTTDIAAVLTEDFGSMPEVKSYGVDNKVKITTKYKINVDGIEPENEITQILYDNLNGKYTNQASYEDFKDKSILSSQKVGPTIADDIKWAAALSILLGLLGIFIYIFIRFKRWQYGLGGVVALLHDGFFVISIFSLLNGVLPFSLDVDQAFIACILTVIGYSINDSVIIYDRIREYKTLFTKRSNLENFNGALNSTLSRTLNTSLTTLVSIIVIFIFGGESIRSFVFGLIMGIGVGTYSSIFISSAITFDTLRKVDIVVEDKKKFDYKGGKKKDKLDEEVEVERD